MTTPTPNLNDWYFVVQNTSSTNSVYSTSANAYVGNTTAAYTNWMSSGNVGFSAVISAMANDGSGHPRLTVPANTFLASNQRWFFEGLDGTSSANGAQTITQINASTIDLDSVTFVAGTLGSNPLLRGATIETTNANVLNTIGRSASTSAFGTAPTDRFLIATSLSANLTLTNPMPLRIIATSQTVARTIFLPAMNKVDSIPVGTVFIIENTASPPGLDVLLASKNSSFGPVTISPGMAVIMQLTSNTTEDGGFNYIQIALVAQTGFAFGNFRVQSFVASGTYTPSTGMQYCWARGVGGGAGGGGILGTAGDYWAAGGGGAGAYAEKRLTAAAIGASKTVTIGAGGIAGAAGDNDGGAGGDTSLGTLLIAKGGTGTGTKGTVRNGGPAGLGSASTGDYTATGGGGGGGFISVGDVVHGSRSGAGGDSVLGGGAPAGSGTGLTATGPGGGGSGAVGTTVNVAGGAGAPGALLIVEMIVGAI